jgi:hypothetical protein
MKFIALVVFSIVIFSITDFAQNARPQLSDHDQVRLVVFQALLEPWLPEPRRDQSAYAAKTFYF